MTKPEQVLYVRSYFANQIGKKKIFVSENEYLDIK